MHVLHACVHQRNSHSVMHGYALGSGDHTVGILVCGTACIVPENLPCQNDLLYFGLHSTLGTVEFTHGTCVVLTCTFICCNVRVVL